MNHRADGRCECSVWVAGISVLQLPGAEPLPLALSWAPGEMEYPCVVKRRSKKEIKEFVENLKDKPFGSSGFKPYIGKLSPKKTSQRIRKQGV